MFLNLKKKCYTYYHNMLLGHLTNEWLETTAIYKWAEYMHCFQRIS